MKRRLLLNITLSFMLLFFLSGYIQAQPLFSDIKGHPHQAVIEKWQEKGIIQGYNGRFRPDEPITRAEFAVLLNRLIGYSPQADVHFSDIPSDSWYAHDMLSLYSANILTAIEGKAEPTKLLRLSQARQMLNKALAIETENPNPDGDHNLTRAETILLFDQAIAGFYHQKGAYQGTINGNVIVRKANVSLKNMKIKGNLYIMEGVAEGEVDLDNVKVSGRLFVRGGGKNSIHINNCEINELISTKDKVRIVLANGTSVTFLHSQLKNGIIELGDCKVKNLTILGDGLQVKLKGQSAITNLNVEANQVKIEGEKTALIHQANLKGQAKISGQLTINQALITKNGSHIENPPLQYQLANGVSVKIGEQTTALSKGEESTSSDSSDSPYLPLPPTDNEMLQTHSIPDKTDIPYKTSFAELNLPVEAVFTSNKANHLTVNLNWQENDYNPLTVGKQIIKAKVSAVSGSLPQWVPAEIQIAVTVMAPPLPQTIKVVEYNGAEAHNLLLYRGHDTNLILQIYDQNNTKMKYSTLKEMGAKFEIAEIEGITTEIKTPNNDKEDILLLISVPQDYVPSEVTITINCKYDFLSGGMITKSIFSLVWNASAMIYPPIDLVVNTETNSLETDQGQIHITYTEPDDLSNLQYYKCGFKEVDTEKEIPLNILFFSQSSEATVDQYFDPCIQDVAQEIDPWKDYYFTLTSIGKKPNTSASTTATGKKFRFQEDTDFQKIVFRNSIWLLNIQDDYVELIPDSLDYYYEGQEGKPEKECFCIDVRYKGSQFYEGYVFLENGQIAELQPPTLYTSEEIDFSDFDAFDITFRRAHPLQKLSTPDTYLHLYSFDRWLHAENREIRIK
ncbi:S-layer homology domain-containing protein [Clostridiales bacterium COT073_COT-073]|nr:S-layer homology domain-containing protein [Clostridiales bacterium COT073_COT-073]